MAGVKPKKHLGQHFLKEKDIARQIVEALPEAPQGADLVEIGPGTGILTDLLFESSYQKFLAIDLDLESINYLKSKYPDHTGTFVFGDFLKMDFGVALSPQYAIIGNFPYNISSQIFFTVLEQRQRVTSVVGMLQKEVGDRIASKPGSKVYGILSVLVQAFYDVENLFIVEPDSFHPPPKVRSTVLRCIRNSTAVLPCDEKLFFSVVKMAFQKRRKTLRNALKELNLPSDLTGRSLFDLRAEQLSVDDFVHLTQEVALWKP